MARPGTRRSARTSGVAPLGMARPSTLLWASFLWGAAFGCAARWGRFCLLRGVRQGMGHDHSEPRGHAPALQAFALALAVALLASQGLQWLGVIDLAQAQIVRPSFSRWGCFWAG